MFLARLLTVVPYPRWLIEGFLCIVSLAGFANLSERSRYLLLEVLCLRDEPKAGVLVAGIIFYF